LIIFDAYALNSAKNEKELKRTTLCFSVLFGRVFKL